MKWSSFCSFLLSFFLLQACTNSNEPIDTDITPFVKTAESCQFPVGLSSFFDSFSQSDLNKTPYEAFVARQFIVDRETYTFEQDSLDDESEMPRSVQYEFHAWFNIRAILSQSFKEGPESRRRMLLALREFVVEYARKNRFSQNDYRTQKAEGFQWYDMGVGLRALTLGALLKTFSCEEMLSEEQQDILHAFAIDHVAYLRSDEFHSGHNNHGAFQSAGAIGLCGYYSVLPNCSELYATSSKRLRSYFDGAIVGGVHTEHSTAYMVYILDLLAALKSADGLAVDLKEYLNSQLEELSQQLEWFIAPDGSEIRIGDTDEKKFPITSLLKAPKESVSGALWLASNGVMGQPPSEKFWFSKQAGYAASRNAETGEYVLFSAAFHSRTHKHADDGNLLWFTKSKPILIDSGKYGYLKKSEIGSVLRETGFWYADPKRVYVESNRAHNVVEIDSVSTNRREAIAYGSAIAGATTDGDGATAFEMVLDREEEVHQKRTVIHQSGRFLLVIDDLVSSRGMRDYRQWFQIAPRFDKSEIYGNILKLNSESGEFVRISEHGGSVKIEAFWGQDGNILQGWHSKGPASFYPNFSISLEKKGAHSKFVTLIEYFGVDNGPYVMPVVDIEFKDTDAEIFRVLDSYGSIFEYELKRGEDYKIVSRQP